MRWRTTILLPLTIIVAFNLILWANSTRTLGPLPISFSLFVLAIATCALAALLVNARAPGLPKPIMLPDGSAIRFRDSADATAEMLELQRELLDKVNGLADSFATRQDTQHIAAYLEAMRSEAQWYRAREQVLQRNQAIATTAIGLIGSWLPSLVAYIATQSPFR